MKILYSIQGTGNGHVARALDVIPVLQKFGEVDLVLSGNQCDITLPWEIKYRFHGAGFIFGKKGGVDLWETIKNINLINFLLEIIKIPVRNYDLVINDFEPVVAWACKLKAKQCIGISHQAAVLHKMAPQPHLKNALGRSVLKYYAPATKHYGFHFKKLGHDIFTPVIRNGVRALNSTKGNHFTVYLPSYSNEAIVAFLSKFIEVKWDVFSKHCSKEEIIGNVKIQPVNKDEFIKSMASSIGVFCNAGFETPAEALFLKKKLCVIPMTGQYEQQCNAAMLQSLGVPVFSKLDEINDDSFRKWLSESTFINVEYNNDTDWIISSIVKAHSNINIEEPVFI